MASQYIVEQKRLYNLGDMDGVRKIETYFAEIAQKLYPDRDWNAEPVQFRLADEDAVDASIFAHAKPPVIVISRGILSFIANEDELAFVIGHELGHDSIKRNVGSTAEVTKGEEGGADIIATRGLIKAGYRPDAGIEFFRRLQKKIDVEGKDNVLGGLYSAVFDPHPLNGNRIVAIEFALSHASIFERGKLEFKEPIPLASTVTENLGSAKHQTFIESWLPADYASWAPAKRLRRLMNGFEQSTSAQDTLLNVRLRPILDEVQKIKTDGSAEYREAAEEFVRVAASHDPYNSEYRFDGVYRAVAQTFKDDDKPNGYIAMGPFRKLGEALQKLSALAPEQDDEITRTARTVSSELSNLSSYYNDKSSDDMMSMGFHSSFGSGFGFERKQITPRSTVIRSTEINDFSRPPTLAALYPLAINSAAAETIWRLGGGYDAKYWELIGPSQVQRLMSVQPLAGGAHGYGTQDGRNRSFVDMQTKVGVWLRQKYKPLVTKEPETISQYVSQYQDELFPMSGGVGTILSGTHPEAQKFQAFVALKFTQATGEQKKELIQELDRFYDGCSRWCGELGRQSYFKIADYAFKFASDSIKKARSVKDLFREFSSFRERPANPIPLPENHPYMQMLSVDDSLDSQFKIRQVERISHPDQISQETARRIYGFAAPTTIEGCVDLYASMVSGTKYGGTQFQSTFVSREIEQIVRAKTSMNLGDADLSELAKIVPDNPAYKYVAGSIVSKETIDVIADKLWRNGSINNVSAAFGAKSLDECISIYRFLDRNRLFPTPAERSAVGNAVLRKFKEADPAQKLDACEKLLLRTAGEGSYSEPDRYVTANLALRDEVLKIWQAELVRKYGVDSGHSDYQAEVGKKLDQILARSAARDQDVILETLADGLVIQSGLASKIRNSLKPTAKTLRDTHLPIAGAEALFYEFERDEKLRLAFIDFLSEPLNKKSLAMTAVALKSNKHALAGLAGVEGMTRHNEQLILTPKQDLTVESNLQDLHDHFGYLSVEQRSALLSMLLVPGEQRLEAQKYADSYDKALQLVMGKVFPATSENASDTRSFISAYLETATDHERMALLAGMLAVSVDRDPTVSTSTAMQATKIMAALGPAYVKLGQAINSHPQCPEDWREATGGLKSAAKTDPRWTLIQQLEDRMPDTPEQSISYFGPVLGSASFNTAMQVSLKQADQTIDAVALIERPCAAARAEGGFEHLERTVAAWVSPTAKEHGDTILEMLGEGRAMAQAETSLEAGEAQYAHAKENYGARQIAISENNQKTVININPVDSLASATGIRLVSLAAGTHFSDLPETTSAEKALKRTIAKAYVTLEMGNILSGKPFDCDRHGKQLKVNMRPDNAVDLNLYDFGGMATDPPTDHQKKALGQALNAVASGIMQGKKPETIIAAAIARTKDIEDRQYLMRTRKAWLALSDFMRHLDGKQDYVDILKAVVTTGVDPVIKKEMPVLSMLSFAGRKAEITIGIQTEAPIRQASKLDRVHPQISSSADDVLPTRPADNGPTDKASSHWWPWGDKGQKLIRDLIHS